MCMTIICFGHAVVIELKNTVTWVLFTILVKAYNLHCHAVIHNYIDIQLIVVAPCTHAHMESFNTLRVHTVYYHCIVYIALELQYYYSTHVTVHTHQISICSDVINHEDTIDYCSVRALSSTNL